MTNKIIFYELEDVKDYHTMLQTYQEKTSKDGYEIGGLSHLAEISILKVFLARKKISMTKELIDNIFEESDNEKNCYLFKLNTCYK